MKRFLCFVFGHNWGYPLMWPLHMDGDCDRWPFCTHMAQDCKRCGFNRMYQG